MTSFVCRTKRALNFDFKFGGGLQRACFGGVVRPIPTPFRNISKKKLNSEKVKKVKMKSLEIFFEKNLISKLFYNLIGKTEAQVPSKSGHSR